MKPRHIAFFIVLLVAIMCLFACKVTKQSAQSSIRVDSVFTVKRDTSYFSKDSSGANWERETIREYHYKDTGSTIYVPYPVKETIREKGSTYYISTDSGRVINLDSLNYYREELAKSKTVTKTTPIWKWVGFAVLAALVVFIIWLLVKKRPGLTPHEEYARLITGK